VTGFLDGGGTVSTAFNGLTAATTELIGFINLDAFGSQVQAMAASTTSSCIPPNPRPCLLLVAGFASMAAILRRRRPACA